jgi:hypothetical protein
MARHSSITSSLASKTARQIKIKSNEADTRNSAIDAARPRAPRERTRAMTNTTTATATTKKRQRIRRWPGVAPHPAFDFDSLPDSVWLSTLEVAAVLRRSKITVELWRRQPDHPLRWERCNGRPLYKARWVRDYIAR